MSLKILNNMFSLQCWLNAFKLISDTSHQQYHVLVNVMY